jgi:large subunit ribosomal protein L47
MRAYWKHTAKNSYKSIFPTIRDPANDISQLTAGITSDELKNSSSSNGRSWRPEELRLKSDQDLHKLWYVLLKEKLALRSDLYHTSQAGLVHYKVVRANLNKVCVSMARLKTILGEREMQKNNFMQFLEFCYIKKAQREERRAEENKDSDEKESKTDKEESKSLSKKEKRAQNGTNKQPKRSIRGVLEDKSNEKVNLSETKETNSEDLNNIQTEPLNKDDKEQNKNIKRVTVLNETELAHVKNLKKKYTKTTLLAKYVENKHLLSKNQRNKVIDMIQKTRAQTAKSIFLKEMSAVSYKLKNSSKNEKHKKLENLI